MGWSRTPLVRMGRAPPHGVRGLHGSGAPPWRAWLAWVGLGPPPWCAWVGLGGIHVGKAYTWVVWGVCIAYVFENTSHFGKHARHTRIHVGSAHSLIP
jgi:hypothetical protein